MSRVAWLLMAALLLMIGSFVVLAQWGGAPPGSTYVPAHFEEGKFVPGVDEVTRPFVRRRAGVTEHPDDRKRCPSGGSRLHAAPLRDLAALDRDGEQARVVGGAVRNTLLGEPPGDIDIATTAVPDEVVRRVEQRASSRCRPASSMAPSPPWPPDVRSKSRPCARMSKPSGDMPRLPSAAAGDAMPSVATSP